MKLFWKNKIKKNLLDHWTNALYWFLCLIVLTDFLTLFDQADDGKDEGKDKLEEAEPVDGLFEGDPEEGFDAHDCSARDNSLLIANMWMSCITHRAS